MFYFQAKKKKKNCNRVKPTASPMDYRGSPQILKKKKKKNQRIRNQTHVMVTSLAEKSETKPQYSQSMSKSKTNFNTKVF